MITFILKRIVFLKRLFLKIFKIQDFIWSFRVTFWNYKFSEKLPWPEFYNSINRLHDNRRNQYKFRVINNIFTARLD